MDPRFGGASGFSRHTSPSSELATRFYSGGYNEAGNLYAETRTIGVMSEGDINQREADIEGLNRVFSEYMEEWDAINETLADWLSRHPTFAKEFGFVDEGRDKPRIDNYRLEELFTGGGPKSSQNRNFSSLGGTKKELHELRLLSMEIPMYHIKATGRRSKDLESSIRPDSLMSVRHFKSVWSLR